MKIIVDENAPRKVVWFLRNLGFDVLYVAETSELQGIRNLTLLLKSFELNAILITCDSDFLTYEDP